MANEKLAKDAVRMWKEVQMYMGDRPMNKTDTEVKLAHSIVAACISAPELRDELYCQLCKQTCYNPLRTSSFKGWELFVVAVLNFPPTRNLESSLRCYWEEHVKVRAVCACIGGSPWRDLTTTSSSCTVRL